MVYLAYNKWNNKQCGDKINELPKYLCLLLRHLPDKVELDMDEHGWVSVEQLIGGVNGHSNYKLDHELLEQR